MTMVLIIALATLPLAELLSSAADQLLRGRLERYLKPVLFLLVGLGLAWWAGEHLLLGLAGAGLATLLRIVGMALLGVRDLTVAKTIRRR